MTRRNDRYGLGALGMYGGGVGSDDAGGVGQRAESSSTAVGRGVDGGTGDGTLRVETVRMSVFQPRVFPGPQTIAMPAEELLYWAEHELQGAASLALAGKGDFAAGSHCRFCKAKANSTARKGC